MATWPPYVARRCRQAASCRHERVIPPLVFVFGDVVLQTYSVYHNERYFEAICRRSQR